MGSEGPSCHSSASTIAFVLRPCFSQADLSQCLSTVEVEYQPVPAGHETLPVWDFSSRSPHWPCQHLLRTTLLSEPLPTQSSAPLLSQVSDHQLGLKVCLPIPVSSSLPSMCISPAKSHVPLIPLWHLLGGCELTHKM